MKRIPVLVLMLLTVVATAVAQQKSEKNRLKFSSINGIGLLSGGSGEALFVQSINGVAKNKWFAGAGIAADYYSYRTVPVFVDVRRDLLNGKNTPFIYGDAGMNLPWPTDEQKTAKGGFGQFKNGYYFDAGFGLKLKGKDQRAFLFSVGYSQKQVKEEVEPFWWGWTPQPSTNDKQYFDSRFRRINLKISVQL